jgi:hypothetical protein
MKNRIIQKIVNKLFLLIVIFIVTQVKAQDQKYSYSDSWGREGITIKSNSSAGISLNFSINDFSLINNSINGEVMQNIKLSGSFLPNDAGFPDLPGNSRYIAIPQGAKPILKIVSYRIERINNVNIAPAYELPLETVNNQSLLFKKNNIVYSKNDFYPAQPVYISQPSIIRGVDVVMLGIKPFQYNPVTKELIVYRDINIEISFEGGNGQFGDNKYRSRWWNPILEDVLLNYDALPAIDYSKREMDKKDSGFEYLIVIPNNPEFQQWADSIKAFRTEQGILTGIVKLSDIPNSNTTTGLKTYFNNAYNNWNIPPSAILLLGDYGTDVNSTIISNLYIHPEACADFPSDNFYADINGDDLPDIVFARIPANNAAQLQTMCSKFINFERNPPMAPDFYDQPVTSYPWLESHWYALGAEVIGGFFRNNGKHPARIFSFTPTSSWSTAANTSSIVNYFGPAGLNYIPAYPIGITGQNDLVDSINNGTFMLLYRGLGSYYGWDLPSFVTANINQLTNVDNKLPFVFSITSQTGAYHLSDECFSEKFHRWTYNGQNSGALGLVAASEITYSFVNEVFTWGMFDYMWPDFMPGYSSTPQSRGALPAFGCVAGKYFLAQSNWPSNTSDKQITYRLFHMQGDAFLTMYSEVPQNLTVNHLFYIPSGTDNFDVTADAGSFIALTSNGEILGTAIGTGSPVNISLSTSLLYGNTMVVTITKQNYKRYRAIVNVSVGINENTFTDNNFNICPNPNKGVFSITSDIVLNDIYNIKILNAMNILVYEKYNIIANGKLNQSLDLQNLPAGIYYLIIENKDVNIIKKFAITK